MLHWQLAEIKSLICIIMHFRLIILFKVMKMCFCGFHLSYYDKARTRSDCISAPTYPIPEEHSKETVRLNTCKAKL